MLAIQCFAGNMEAIVPCQLQSRRHTVSTKNLINRTNLPTEPKNVNAVEDFLTVVRVGHTVAAAIEFFRLECMKDANVPKRNVPCGFDTMFIDDKRKAYHNMVLEFVRTYVNLIIIKPPPSSASK